MELEFKNLADGRMKFEIHQPKESKSREKNISIYVDKPTADNKNLGGECEIKDGKKILYFGWINFVDKRAHYYIRIDLEKKVKGFDWDEAFQLCALRMRDYYAEGTNFVNLDDVQAQDFPLPLIDPVIDYTINMWAAHGDTGKSLLSLIAAHQVSTGLEILGSCGHEPMNVMILDYEELDEQNAARRNQLIKNGHPVPVQYEFGDAEIKKVWYRNEFAPITRTAPTLRRIIHELDVGLVILDSLGLARGGNAENSSDTIAAMDAIKSLSVPSLVLDHLKQGKPGEDGQDRPFGSVYTRNLVRSLWTVERDQEEDSIVFTHRKGNHKKRILEEKIYRIEWENERIFCYYESI